MSAPDDADVIIVGGGPAGSATALHLARKGHRVVLFDRAQFPRPKPCGDSINSAGVRELAGLGVLEEVLAHPHRRLNGWRIHPGGDAGFLGSFPPDARPIAIARERLDMVLLERARSDGVEVQLGERVVELCEGRAAGLAGCGWPAEERGARGWWWGQMGCVPWSCAGWGCWHAGPVCGSWR